MKNKFLFSVFVYFIILVLISLGSWQLYRLNWKLNLISEINSSLKTDPVELSKSNKKNYFTITSNVETNSKTGVEMEALTAVNVASLTFYDMCKALSKNIIIKNIRLIKKTGGKSDFQN